MESRLDSAPLSALGSKTRDTLAVLDCLRVLPAPCGLARDWRGLQSLIFPRNAPSMIADAASPTKRLLQIWQERPLAEANMQLLCDYLERIDRFDILEDITELLKDDTLQHSNNGDRQVVEFMSNVSVTEPLDIFDAFVMYAEEDVEYAQAVIQNMSFYKLKVCEKEDLLAGSFQHNAIMEIIASRCKVILILTPNFFNSPAHTFFVSFAQAIGIDQKQRKIVPCVFEKCPIPVQISFIFHLSYERYNDKSEFWEKLRNSIETSLQSGIVSSRRSPSPYLLKNSNTNVYEVVNPNVQQNNLQIVSRKETFVNNSDKLKSITNNNDTQNNACAYKVKNDIQSNVESSKLNSNACDNIKKPSNTKLTTNDEENAYRFPEVPSGPVTDSDLKSSDSLIDSNITTLLTDPTPKKKKKRKIFQKIKQLITTK